MSYRTLCLLPDRDANYSCLNKWLITFLISWFLYSTTLVPLGANPYLCTSTDIEVTPLTVKSKGGIGYLKFRVENNNKKLKKGGSRTSNHQKIDWANKNRNSLPYPSLRAKGSTKPPRQRSTWRQILKLVANSPRSYEINFQNLFKYLEIQNLKETIIFVTS